MYIILEFLVHFYKFIESLLISIFLSSKPKIWITKTFRKASITFNGDNPWDIRVNNEKIYKKVISFASLAMGEGYIDGWWDCDDIEEMSYRIFKHDLFKYSLTLANRICQYLLFNVVNLQTKIRAWEVGKKHYDLGNELFSSFLDPTMNYSCGYWRRADNLNQAQIDKMELIAQKLKLKPGMKVLDIGCGWGSLAKYLAENHEVSVVGCTISEEQVKLGKERCAGLPVDIRMQDYRDMNEKFDRIVSVGMFEHVGEDNYNDFFTVARDCLVDDGIFLLHTIGVNHKNVPLTEPFTHKYIFPNGKLPYYAHIPKYTEGKFIIEDWHNFGADYSKTLRAWHKNFVKNWPKLEDKYGERFYRMWSFYLQSASGMFRSRKFQLWQIVLTKNGLPGGYQAPR